VLLYLEIFVVIRRLAGIVEHGTALLTSPGSKDYMAVYFV